MAVETVEVCGIRRPDTWLCRNWPRVCCLLDDGHPGQHEAARRDGVSFVWPRLEGEEKGIWMRRPAGTTVYLRV